jgi:hypothetical protein
MCVSLERGEDKLVFDSLHHSKWHYDNKGCGVFQGGYRIGKMLAKK